MKWPTNKVIRPACIAQLGAGPSGTPPRKLFRGRGIELSGRITMMLQLLADATPTYPAICVSVAVHRKRDVAAIDGKLTLRRRQL